MRAWLAVFFLVGCADPDMDAVPEGAEDVALAWGTTERLTVSLETYSDVGLSYITVEGRFGVVARHLADDQLHLLMLDGDVLVGPGAGDEFCVFSNAHGPAVVLTHREGATDAWVLDADGFVENRFAPSFGRWGAVTEGVLVGEFGPEVVAFELATGAQSPVMPPTGVRRATAPISNQALELRPRTRLESHLLRGLKAARRESS